MSTRPLTITRVETVDVRFPTSRTLDGSDAMNPDPDYSAPYVILHTDDQRLTGHGFAFTIGPGTEVCVAAIDALAPHVVGLDARAMFADMGGLYRRLIGISAFRWLGPEKGVMHMAIGAILNAVWDLFALDRGQPLWKLISEMTPEEQVSLIDFRYLTDALTPPRALERLQSLAPGRAERTQHLLDGGLPAYTTSAGWLGYDDDKIRRLCREAIDQGFRHVKIKVGRDVDDDVRRCAIVREVIGNDRYLMVDANQVWSVPDAIEWMRHLARFDPLWIEEPTSPDDILGHATIARAVAPIRVASGEHIHNRVMFKQFLQSGALGFCQVDACRVASVNEVLAILLLAAEFGVPVCPHAGGVGLCELVVHLAAVDYICVSGSLDERVVEYVDHLHEHFEEPAAVVAGRYRLPREPGYARMHAASIERHRFPDGPEWSTASRPPDLRPKATDQDATETTSTVKSPLA
jgi:L-fuconate dehydratase